MDAAIKFMKINYEILHTAWHLDRAETNIKYLGYALDYTSIKYSRVAYLEDINFKIVKNLLYADYFVNKYWGSASHSYDFKEK